MLSEGARQWMQRPAACTEPGVRVSQGSTAQPPESSIFVCPAQVTEIPESLKVLQPSQFPSSALSFDGNW